MPQDAPREVFAQLLPVRGKTRGGAAGGLVTSVLAPIAGLQGGNGAKQIDVIARYTGVIVIVIIISNRASMMILVDLNPISGQCLNVNLSRSKRD